MRTRSTSSRLHLSAKDSRNLLDPTKNSHLGKSPAELANALGVDYTPVLEPIFDVRGQKLANINNIVNPKTGHSLGTAGDRFKPLGAPGLCAIAETVIQNVSQAKMLYGWQIEGGKKYGFKMLIGGVREVVNKGDTIGMFLDIYGGSDGHTPWSIRGSLLRLVCTNGMAAHNLFHTNWGRHTLNADIKISNATLRSINAIAENSDTMIGQIADLAHKPMTEVEALAFFRAYSKRMEPSNEAKADQMVRDLFRLMGNDTQTMSMVNGQMNAYQAYNSITEYNSFAGVRDYKSAFLNQISGNYIDANAAAFDLLAA